ncbi:MAG: hypothetical protein CEN92_152 [Candidatus Berkelbacteria bacterium Licking1014_96]|uniref:Ribonuclease P protein component n=1 Tax=Candidatus Berkelbacteria bacterium Licking1014_96 TaxID=2017149 RepID=A0A554LGV8_9BACT|nr:MAG: hypothetical protein CEN92_152 [Candidatus Berkelbacteria bacterium Licking1014_96]
MLPLNFRLKKAVDFRRVYRRGRHSRGFFFDIAYLIKTPEQPTRFGVVTTTKLIGRATKRNLAKRILRGLLIKNQNNWPPRADIIIKIKRELEDKKRAAEELDEILKRIKRDG